MHPWLRLGRALGYFLCGAASIVTMVTPSAIVLMSIGPLTYFWSGLLLMGSLIALAGILSKTWVGEYIGLYGVIASLVLYSAGCFANYTPIRLFLGLMFLAFAMFCIARLRDVQFQKRVSDFEQRVKDGKRGL